MMIGAMLVLTPGTFFAQSPAPKTSRIVGIVIDSLHQSGLEGAEVIVSGLASPVITDSLGRFSVDSLAPGTYQVGVFHPLIESLGLTLASKPFNVGRDSTGVVSLAIPSVTTLASRYCGKEVTSAHPAVVAGRVLDPDSDVPVSGAKISLAWVDMVVSKETGVVRTPHQLRADADSTGFFRFCGLPEDLDAVVQGERGGVSTGEVAISTHGSQLTFENLAVASSSENSKKGVVRGTVVSLDNQPVKAARVEAPMWGVAVVTKDDGTFNLEGVPIGTQLIVVRHIGFEVERVSVNVTSRQPIEVRVTLGPSVNVLDPVLVTARANYALDKDGFTARQRNGWGKYFTREQIQKRNPYNLTDILTEVPGIRITRGIGGASVQSERASYILGGGRGGGCTRVWVDGFEWHVAEAGDIDTFVSPRDVLGLEVYKAHEAPIQFRGVDDNCIVLVVWTR
jgi:protocatechuate 3,4-dioxygenase beta subunit